MRLGWKVDVTYSDHFGAIATHKIADFRIEWGIGCEPIAMVGDVDVGGVGPYPVNVIG